MVLFLSLLLSNSKQQRLLLDDMILTCLFCRGKEQGVSVREGTRHTLSVCDAVAAAFISRKAAVVLVPFLLPVSENVSCSLLIDQELIDRCYFFYYLKQDLVSRLLFGVYCYDLVACLYVL
jgi:hypothetical protein